MLNHSEVTLPKVVILGLGNILFQDEGLGVRAAERLQNGNHFPDFVEVMDGGTIGLRLLPYFRGVSHLLILDTLDAGQPPGTIMRLEGGSIPVALTQKFSMHQVGLQELLVAGTLSGTLPEKIVLLGVQPDVIDWGLQLTLTIENTLEQLVDLARQELVNWGLWAHPAS